MEITDTAHGDGTTRLYERLQKMADILDPDFEFEPLPEGSSEAAGDAADFAHRCQLLWEIYIDGRLMRAGRLPPAVEQLRRDQFEAEFAGLGGAAEAAFDSVFRPRAALRHRDLIDFARQVPVEDHLVTTEGRR